MGGDAYTEADAAGSDGADGAPTAHADAAIAPVDMDEAEETAAVVEKKAEEDTDEG